MILILASKLDCDEGCFKLNTMKKSRNDCLYEAVSTWHTQKRSSGQPISGSMLCEEALVFSKKLEGCKFSACQGCLEKF